MLFKLSLRYLRPYWPAVIAVGLLQIIQTIAGLTLPTLNASIIDEGVLETDIPRIWGLGGVMIAIAFVHALAALFVAFLASRTAMSVGRDLRRDQFATVQTFGVIELNKFTPPSLITRATNDVQQIQMVLLMTLSIMVQVPIVMVGGILMAVRQDAPLSWILVVLVPVLGILVGIAMSKMGPIFASLQNRIDDINTVMREQLTGVRVIRAFVRQKGERDRFEKTSTQLRATATRIGMWMAFLFPAVMVIVSAAQVAVIYFGGMRIDAGAMLPGSLIAFINYLMQVFMAVMMAAMMFMIVPRGEISARRVGEVLATTASITSPKTPTTLPAEPLTLELDDVSVRFPGAESDVLSHISLKLEPGTTTALIGSTGSGKTTLVNLFPRIIEASGGLVTASGVPVQEAELSSLRQRIAVVPQRAFLFKGTIASNLRMARADASEEEMWQALAHAQADDFVRALEGGLEAPVEQGGKNFSGGQRQRLTIARALLRKADLTIFDDSFSALDFATDARLRAALPEALGNRAVFIVAQRVATIRNATNIVVLEKGRIVGQGTHSHLMETCEAYQEIVLSQLSAEEAA